MVFGLYEINLQVFFFLQTNSDTSGSLVEDELTVKRIPSCDSEKENQCPPSAKSPGVSFRCPLGTSTVAKTGPDMARPNSVYSTPKRVIVPGASPYIYRRPTSVERPPHYQIVTATAQHKQQCRQVQYQQHRSSSTDRPAVPLSMSAQARWN